MSPSEKGSAKDGRVLLSAEGIITGYTDVDILHGVSLEVGHGEIVSIIGPNGAGKSTLIKAIAGLLPKREGKVVFDGDEVTRWRPYRIVERGLSYVPQLDNIFPSLSVKENLELGAWVNRERMDEAFEVVYDRFPLLEERRRERAGTLSGGQRQMLALGRALMSGPQLLVLDEPSAGLAPAVVDEVFEAIEQINRDGLAVLLVEQNARRALAMSRTGYVLDLGRNRFHGPGAELLHDPQVVELYLGGGARIEAELPPAEEGGTTTSGE
jgi:ABC-type branched-subunit amino acid transport system ATPase component